MPPTQPFLDLHPERTQLSPSLCADVAMIDRLLGGTGDVLSGIIGGLIAQGSDPYAAAVTGVYIHGAAGRRLAHQLGDSGLLASDLLLEIPAVMKVLRQGGL